MRKRIFEIIEVGKDDDKPSKVYDVFMMICIIASLVPLAIRQQHLWCEVVDKLTVVIFFIDYMLRWITADYKLEKNKGSFLIYPFKLMSIIDLISILPSIIIINKTLKALKIIRLIRTFRIFKVMKGFRYSKNVNILVDVFKKQKDSLTVVAVLAVGYILITALIIFNVEPETFDNYFKAVYWATVSLTTMGYGDVYATSTIGQVMTMLSALMGIAIVALPAGIITAGYMKQVEKDQN